MESYVLDKTFLSAGSIGTYLCVRNGTGSPTSLSDIVNRAALAIGTLAVGSLVPMGVSQIGCSESGKEIIVRMLGISKVKLQVVSGTVMVSRFVRPATHAGVKAINKGGGTAGILGQVVYVEGSGVGSTGQLISVMVNPGYI